MIKPQLIVSMPNEEPIKASCQFQYRGYTVSLSTLFRDHGEVMIWDSNNKNDEVFLTVELAINWINDNIAID